MLKYHHTTCRRHQRDRELLSWCQQWQSARKKPSAWGLMIPRKWSAFKRIALRDSKSDAIYWRNSTAGISARWNTRIMKSKTGRRDAAYCSLTWVRRKTDGLFHYFWRLAVFFSRNSLQTYWAAAVRKERGEERLRSHQESHRNRFGWVQYPWSIASVEARRHQVLEGAC